MHCKSVSLQSAEAGHYTDERISHLATGHHVTSLASNLMFYTQSTINLRASLWQNIPHLPTAHLWHLCQSFLSANRTAYDIYVRAYLPTEQPMISMSKLLICPQDSLWRLCQSFLSAHRIAYDIYVRASYLPTEQPMTSMSKLLICPQNSLRHQCQSF